MYEADITRPCIGQLNSNNAIKLVGSTPNLGTVLTLNLTIMKLWVAREIIGWLGLYRTKPIYKIDQYGGNWAGCFMGFVDADLDINKSTLPEVTHANSPQEVELKLIQNDRQQQRIHSMFSYRKFCLL